ncbi:copper chaperone PCu(A)C [Nocardiopsis sp. JB363]|uniref:copper chaperone PCu(A)C n=1 Tax=Nocardiopsis sp. JB363 TaxID=1434837 RepID=UPI000979E465|nr:copper chaperone PCu(A)C [Nocardiopsis sp. JB363]SIO89837.1 Copper metallochaperone, bacterial analog of Cox17 protein [Nocardiopsis sp. JB363]
MTALTTRFLLFPAAVGAALFLGACSSASPEEESATAQEESVLQAEAITVSDPWVKAAAADEGMTAAFGVLTNEGDQDATITAAHAEEVSAMVELHEVVSGDDGNMVMQEKDGGFSVAAGAEHELSPGADHIMIMDLTEDLEPGVEVTITLEFEDGSTQEFTAPVKDFEGANENYDDDHEGHGDTDDHGDHGEDDDH